MDMVSLQEFLVMMRAYGILLQDLAIILTAICMKFMLVEVTGQAQLVPCCGVTITAIGDHLRVVTEVSLILSAARKKIGDRVNFLTSRANGYSARCLQE